MTGPDGDAPRDGHARLGAPVPPDPARPLAARLVAPSSRRARKVLWGAGAAPFALLPEAGADRHGPVPLWLDRPLGIAPDLGTDLDYAVFAGLARDAGDWLAAAGTRPGDVVAIVKQANVDVVALALGAAQIGAVPALLAPDFAPGTTAELLRRLSPAITVTDESTAAAQAQHLTGHKGPGGRVLTVDGPPDGPRTPLDAFRTAKVAPRRPRTGGDLVAVTHTSGTTGVPKLIGHSADTLTGQAAVQVLGGRLLLSGDDTVATCLTSAHARTLSGLATLAAVGAPHLAMVDPDPASAGPLLARRRPSLIETFPNVFLRWEALALHPDRPFSNVRIFLSTFDAAHPRTIRTLLAASRRRLPVYAQAYAQSELGAIALSFRTRVGPDRDARDVGYPALAFNRLRIVDPDSGRSLRRGELGTIQVRGPGMFAGYVGPTGVTAGTDRDGWWDTGDVGTCSVTGRLRLAGRAVDHLAAQPDYLAWEDVLLDRLPELIEVVVTCGADDRPLVVTCTRDGHPVDAGRWAHAVADLPRIGAPVHMDWDELPTTATWKVRRPELRQMLMSTARGPAAATR